MVQFRRRLRRANGLFSALFVAASMVSMGVASPQKSTKTVDTKKTDTAPASTTKAKEEKTPPKEPIRAEGISRLQILHAPDEIVTAGDCESRVAALTVRATQEGVAGPRIVGGGISDADSKHKLPDSAFELVQRGSVPGLCEKEFVPVTADTMIPNGEITKLYIRLRKESVNAGNFAGDLLLAADGDTTPQTVNLKVFVRPRSAWLWGFIAILLGAILSWWATVWLVRRRQLAVNEILIARLRGLLDSLNTRLEGLQQAGAPPPQQTIEHIAEIRNKLPQLLNDRALAVIAGVTVPAAGEVTLIDEIEGVTRVVHDGFSELSQLWRDHGAAHAALGPWFEQMNQLGGSVAAKSTVEPEITRIINAAKAAVAAALGAGAPAALTAPHSMPYFRQEGAVVQALTRATYWLDAIAILVVVTVGMYVIVWKNPGFGTFGDLLIAFGWGVGLKLGTDAARLAPPDIRATLGVKVPSP
jgi:hypothetical protein